MAEERVGQNCVPSQVSQFLRSLHAFYKVRSSHVSEGAAAGQH